MRKYISTILIAALIMSVCAPASASAAAGLNEAHYSLSSIPLNTAEHIKYMNGYNDGTFGPDNYLTRGEAAQIIYNLLSRHNVPATASYNDVSEGSYYYWAVVVLATLGVIDDSQGSEFRPDDYVTRAEFLAMFSHFENLEEGPNLFTDVPPDYWAAEYIRSAYAKGWIEGGIDSAFRPDGYVNRAEAATMVNRILSRTADRTTIYVQKGITCYSDVNKSHWAYYDILEASTPHSGNNENGVEIWTAFESPRGFYLIDDQLYYADSSGQFVSSTKVGNFRFDSTGRYTTGNARLDSYLTSIVSQVTDDSMSRYQKLQAVYGYVRDNFTYMKRSHNPRGANGWEEESALFFLDNRMGNCYCYAATFMYLARRLGYNAYCVSGGVGNNDSDHGWVMILFDDGQEYIFDVGLEYSYVHEYDSPEYLNRLFKFTLETAPFKYFFP